MEEEAQVRERFLLVCQGLFCMSRGSWFVLDKLKKMKEAGELPEEVTVKPYYCFNGCSHGPNVVCYPDKVWFERTSLANLPEVVAFLKDGTPVTDPGLCQKRVLEVVRNVAYKDLAKELNDTSNLSFAKSVEKE